MTPEVRAALLQRREGLPQEVWARHMGPGDPVFFDPHAKDPLPYPVGRKESEMLEAMRKAGIPPEIVYAYKRTGRLIMEGVDVPARARKEWNDAIEEYFELERKAKCD